MTETKLAVCRHEGCEAVAVWEMAPCDSFGEWCDDHVPRGCSCNAIDLWDDLSTEQERDEKGRLLPCCEYDFKPEGFEPGDPEGPRKYREEWQARALLSKNNAA